MIRNIPKNLKTIKKVKDKVKRMYFSILSDNFQVLNFKTKSLTGAFNKNVLIKVSVNKNQVFKIIELKASLFWYSKIKGKLNTSSAFAGVGNPTKWFFWSIEILKFAKPAINNKLKQVLNFPIKSTNRTVGAIISNEISKIHGSDGLPKDTLTVNFSGTAGQSFGTFLSKGVTLNLNGEEYLPHK